MSRWGTNSTLTLCLFICCFLSYGFAQCPSMGNYLEVSACQICFQRWNVGNGWTSALEVERQRGRCWWCVTLKASHHCLDHVTAHLITKGHFLSSETPAVQRRTRQLRQTRFVCARVCVGACVRRHSCSFHVYLGRRAEPSFYYGRHPRRVIRSCGWRGVWGHRVLSGVTGWGRGGLIIHAKL